ANTKQSRFCNTSCWIRHLEGSGVEGPETARRYPMKKLVLIAPGLLLLLVPALLLWKFRDQPVPEPEDPPEHLGPAVARPDQPPADRERAPALPTGDVESEAPPLASGRPSVTLLRLPRARLVRTTALPSEADGLAALTDDRSDTVAEATASADAPLEVVYGFGGRAGAAAAPLVRLPPGRGRAGPVHRP